MLLARSGVGVSCESGECVRGVFSRVGARREAVKKVKLRARQPRARASKAIAHIHIPMRSQRWHVAYTRSPRGHQALLVERDPAQASSGPHTHPSYVHMSQASLTALGSHAPSPSISRPRLYTCNANMASHARPRPALTGAHEAPLLGQTSHSIARSAGRARTANSASGGVWWLAG